MRWMFGLLFSYEYSLCTHGFLINYLSLLLLISVFLIKLNTLSPENGVSLFVSSNIFINPNSSLVFSSPFPSVKNSTQPSRSASLSTTFVESLLNVACQVVVRAVSSESSHPSVSFLWIMPRIVLCDLHPHILGVKLHKGKDFGSTIYLVQHVLPAYYNGVDKFHKILKFEAGSFHMALTLRKLSSWSLCHQADYKPELKPLHRGKILAERISIPHVKMYENRQKYNVSVTVYEGFLFSSLLSFPAVSVFERAPLGKKECLL